MKATFQCKEKTKNAKFSDRAAKSAADHPKLLENFLSDFKKLCFDDSAPENRFIEFDSKGKRRGNPDYFKKDILTTCAVARTHWNEIAQKFQTKVQLSEGEGGLKGAGFAGTTGGTLASGSL